MSANSRRSAISLVLAGTAGAVFFWLTDPRWGYAMPTSGSRELVDAINEAWPGTVLGIAGSGLVMFLGFWLMLRRST